MAKVEFYITPEAEAEIAESFEWYGEQGEGLNAEFELAVDAALSAIEFSPLAFPEIYRNVRRALVRKFPYSILFTFEKIDDESCLITVQSCFHSKRNPREWQERLT